MRNLRLDAELAQRLSDLEASRRRLVRAQDEARRRIEVDLAPGARARLTVLHEQLSRLVIDADLESAPLTRAQLGPIVDQAERAVSTLDGPRRRRLFGPAGPRRPGRGAHRAGGPGGDPGSRACLRDRTLRAGDGGSGLSQRAGGAAERG